MERGTVVYTGVNSRGNQFGFVRSDTGETVYFNTCGRLFVLVIEDGIGRFSRGWKELFGAKWQASPFPSVGQVLYFQREYGESEMGPRAWQWCEERHFIRLVKDSLSLDGE
jgi:hypothetical protein